MNKVWLDKLGLKIPTTTDELLAVLRAFKRGDPNGNGKADEIPWGACDAYFGFSLLDFLGPWDIMGIKNPAATTIRNGKLDFNPIHPNYRMAMEYFHALYSEGLIEPESLTMNTAALQAKLSQDPMIIGAFMDWDDGFTRNKNEYIVVPPLKGPAGVQKFTFSDTAQVKTGMVIFKNCKNPEVLVRWMDNANSGKNAISIYAGNEGEGWTAKDETKEWRTLDKELAEKGLSFDAYRVTEGLQSALGCYKVSGYTYTDNEYSQNYKKSQWTEMYRPYFFTEYFPASVPIAIATDESREINLLQTELDAYIKSSIADMVMNGVSDNKWAIHIKRCEDLQYKKIVAYHQKRYDTTK
jgi:putative aldouronate transport system substrate-binding protein